MMGEGVAKKDGNLKDALRVDYLKVPRSRTDPSTMTYRIQWDRLSVFGREALDSLGVEMGDSSVTFTRDLSWDEITRVFLYLCTLRQRMTDPDDNHANFAIGDCLVEMERLFGVDRVEQFTHDYEPFIMLRDHILKMAGGTLIYLQEVEHLIMGICSILNLRLTVADFLAEDSNRRRLTLGNLKRALVNTGLFEESFEQEFDDFVNHRNRFVHSLWIEDIRVNQRTVPTEEDLHRIGDFIHVLVSEAQRVKRVFQGYYVAIGQQFPEREHSAEYSTASRLWGRYVPEFANVVRVPDEDGS